MRTIFYFLIILSLACKAPSSGIVKEMKEQQDSIILVKEDILELPDIDYVINAKDKKDLPIFKFNRSLSKGNIYYVQVFLIRRAVDDNLRLYGLISQNNEVARNVVSPSEIADDPRTGSTVDTVVIQGYYYSRGGENHIQIVTLDRTGNFAVLKKLQPINVLRIIVYRVLHINTQLIENAGFNVLNYCPMNSYSTIEAAQSVNRFSEKDPLLGGTLGLYTSCSCTNSKFSIEHPVSVYGKYSYADLIDSGFFSFVGFALLRNHEGNRYRSVESLILPLTRPLIAGKKYKVSIRFAFPPEIQEIPNTLGFKFYFNREEVKRIYENYEAKVDVADFYLLDSIGLNNVTTGQWYKFEITYRAKGGESSIVLGDFLRIDEIFREVRKLRKTSISYLFVDSITVQEEIASK